MSLIVLLFAILILATFGVGLGLVMTAKFHSYPHVARTYQAQALADAGVEFAIRYARDNPASFATNPSAYLPDPGADPNNPVWKKFSFGNGEFWLNYKASTGCQPGKMGTLTCRGMVGDEMREVTVTDFLMLVSKISGNALMMNPTPPWQEKQVNEWGGPWPGILFNGWRVNFKMCGVGQFYGQGYISVPVTWIPPGETLPVPSVTVAVSYPAGYDYVTKPLKLGRLVVSSYAGMSGTNRFVWDEVCDRHPSLYGSEEVQMPHWDGATIPPPVGQFVRPIWNVHTPSVYPSGPRHYDSTKSNYCVHTWPDAATAATLWNSDEYPVAMDFYDASGSNPPPAGTRYYVGIVTRIMDPVTYLQRDVENRFVFTVN